MCLEKYFIDQDEKRFINIVPVSSFAKPCQYLIDIKVGDALFLNLSDELALQLCKLSRLKLNTDHIDRPIDPKNVTEGRYYRHNFQHKYGIHKVPEERGTEINDDAGDKPLPDT
jgi:hypothetical protein